MSAVVGFSVESNAVRRSRNSSVIMEDHDLDPFLQLGCIMAFFHLALEQYVNAFNPCYVLQGNHADLE